MDKRISIGSRPEISAIYFALLQCNLSDAERNQAFWSWIWGFPAALASVLDSEEFQTYFVWECAWAEQQSLIQETELSQIQRALDVCADRCASPRQEISMILNPIQCAYSADYHIDGNHLFFSSGILNPDSAVHEFLHPVVHPFVAGHKRAILQCHALYPGIDPSYYLSGDANGRMNAFEEYMVRKLTDTALTGKFPPDLELYLTELLRDLPSTTP